MVDYYQVLELSRMASAETIKKSYRNLCKKYHPDLNPSQHAVSKMQELNEAYSVLSNEAKRKAYDLKLNRFSASFKGTSNGTQQRKSTFNCARASATARARQEEQEKRQNAQKSNTTYSSAKQNNSYSSTRNSSNAYSSASSNFAASRRNNYNSKNNSTSSSSYSSYRQRGAEKLRSWGNYKSQSYKSRIQDMRFSPIILLPVLIVLILVVVFICSTILSVDNSVDNINKSNSSYRFSQISNSKKKQAEEETKSEDEEETEHYYVSLEDRHYKI
ncbi:MAG: DnaJ domain-containing protein [Clostridiales bacterium]|nr:DnaJ domain-containing protein [Clostridiales bacterium]